MARPRDGASVVALRAAADRAVDEFDEAEASIRTLDADQLQDPSVRELEDGLDSMRALSDALGRVPLSASEVAGLTSQADAVREDLQLLALPRVQLTRSLPR